MNRRSFMGSTTLAAAGILMQGSFSRAMAQATAGSPGATVQTTAGRVRGLLIDRVQAFKGIPYGGSTATAMRFLPPTKPQSWTGVRDAFTLGPRSPQFDSELVPEFAPLNLREAAGEDCLCLNLWTRGTSSGSKRPVMVWLHGGGYSAGSAGFVCYDGKELARKHDVVVIGVNHRLNVFGYLYVADLGGAKYAEAGNPGQRDIIAALEWVRDNVAAFGGDPGNVTLFGQSGGAGKISTLMAMPAARGLFHRAIVQSGSTVTGVPRDTATKAAEAYMTRVGLQPHQIDELQKLPAEKLLAAMRGGPGGPGGPGGGGGGLPLSPVIDGKSLLANPFDPTAPAVSADVPLLIGSTETEVTWSINTKYDPLDDAALKARVKDVLRLQDDGRAEQLISTYKRGRPKASNLDLALIIATDASNFRTGTDTQAERKAALGKAPTYMYRFAWYSPVSGGRIRAMHCLDIPFVFDNVDACRVVTGDGADRYPLAERMSKAWVAFARTGNPNHSGLPSWQPFDATRRTTMLFNNDCTVVDDPYREERLAVQASLGVRQSV